MNHPAPRHAFCLPAPVSTTSCSQSAFVKTLLTPPSPLTSTDLTTSVPSTRRCKLTAKQATNTDTSNKPSPFDNLNTDTDADIMLSPSSPQQKEADDLVLREVLALETNLARYTALMQLLSTDRSRFFRIAQSNLSVVLPIIYTPVVGEACQNFAQLDIPKRGTWLNPWEHQGKILSTLKAQLSANTPNVDVVVVSDCQRILGLGDLGANGMPIPVGKLLLYSAAGGIDPARTLPVVLDVGCDVDSVRDDPDYKGVRKPRVDPDTYDAFVDEFMRAIAEMYGKQCFVQFEDFGNANAARLLTKYRENFLSFNDDIQGTAAVGLAGILAALNIPDVEGDLSKHSFLFLGAGSAGIGIADLIAQMLVSQYGMQLEEARRKCWFIDSKGLVYRGRNARLTKEKEAYAHELPAELQNSNVSDMDLTATINALKPSGLIGVSTQKGSFNEQVFAAMTKHNAKPIVFALSNPTSKAECTAEQAYNYSNGNIVFASGSPFDPVTLGDKTFIPGQGNNCYIFPGLGLGVSLAAATVVDDAMVLAAARKLASLVARDRLNSGCVYPKIDDLLSISAHVAKAVWEEAERSGVAGKSGIDVTVDDIRDAMYEPGRVRLSGY
uniref:Malic enzyme n=1 Tax=Melanothamnus japonicus TaxID=2608613 RepID=A0A097IUI5_9FLOR|nr:malic enzyme [Melanothamnus japonicus]